MQVESAQDTINDLKNELDGARNVDGKNLAEWVAFVNEKWGSIADDIKKQIAPTDEGFV